MKKVIITPKPKRVVIITPKKVTPPGKPWKYRNV